MSEENSITANSTKEEVSEYLAKKFRIKEGAKNNIIKEDISGDILNDLDDKDFKKLGIGLGPLKKIQAFLKDNKDKMGKKEIKEKITIISSSEEVSNFFKNCLNFSGEINNLDGKGLIESDNEAINQLGLNMGQRKKLINYINYFKTLKVEIPEKKRNNNYKRNHKRTSCRIIKKRIKLFNTSHRGFRFRWRDLIDP